jgi:histidinol-phosphate aminotransferase
MTASLPRLRDDLGLMEGYHSPQVTVAVRLNTNESPYPPPAAWWEAVQAELADVSLNRYPDRSAARLRDALATFHGVRAEQVFAANGSNEVLQTLLLAYGGAGRTALTFEPTYALHSHIARLTGTAAVEEEREADFTIDADRAMAAVERHRPAVTFLCSPNNPTGRMEPRAVVEALGAQDGGLLVVDEAYGQFADWTAIDLISDDRPLVVTRTYSKTWSMAGMRLGYVVGPAPVIADLDRVALPYHLDVVKQVAGRLALQYRDEMEARVAALVAERERLAAALGLLPVETWPSGANFILFRPTERKGTEVWQGLLERSVLIRNCASWPRLDDCLRVTIGTTGEDDLFLTALAEVLG